ncbi:MAG TPA: sulfite exporter TauE/SafE family protein [Usitatibacter sp.]|nr:sulfite exporter TauE/SafE family protein [Usitatibacter sp.]
MLELVAYLAIGAVVGFLSGLLGIGGGIIIVSSLALMFSAHAFPAEYVMHMAIATSLGAMLAGSFSSLRTHDQHGAVDWGVVKLMTPGLLAGSLGGAALARFMPTAFLKYVFLAITLFITLQMVLGLKAKATRELPRRGGLAAAGFFVGVISGLFGGGAAAIGVPFLTWCNVSTHRAIGTVAALAFPLAAAGSIGYAAAGWSVAGLPRWSVGFVYLPALVGISASSMLLAPFGARLAHRLPAARLRRIFALVLVVMASKVAVSI